MDESTSTGWPTFEVVAVQVDPGLPPEAAVLATRGVPRRIIGHEFAALPEARPVAGGPGGSLVAFGTSGLRGLICLDLPGGSVVHVPNPDTAERNPVNASLDTFHECAAAVIARFPFYDEDAEPDEWETVADELAATLADLDPATELHNSFWVTFLDDVRMGDYATTMVVDEDD